jgi:Tfp pilus assembly protein PilO
MTMMTKIKQRQRVIDLCGISAMLVLVCSSLAFGVYPLYRRANAAAAESADLRKELSQLDGLSRTLAQVESDRKTTEARLAEAESRLPNSKAMDQFMQQLAKVAEGAGLQVDGISPKPLKESGDYKAMPVDISGTGDWNTCYKFLLGLRTMNRLTRLDELVIDLDKADKPGSTDKASFADRPVCRIRVSISTFMAR